MPRTRAAARRSQETKVIHISSDSEDEPSLKLTKKRKTVCKGGLEQLSVPQPWALPSSSRNGMSCDEYAMDIEAPPVAIQETANRIIPQKPKPKIANLKGTKRFLADLEDLKVESVDAYLEMHGLQIRSLRAGDEEGSIELKVFRDGLHLITLYLLIDDTASYPREHTFYSFAQDVEVPPHVLKVLEKVPSDFAKSLEETVKSLVKSIAASFAQGKYVPQEDICPMEDAYDAENESDNASIYDYIEFDLVPDRSQSQQFSVLRSHLQSVIDAGYKPGLNMLGDDDMVLSISTPITSLSISPRALVAWDRRLLSSYHNLTLLISGLRGYGSIISLDGSFTADAQTKLKFHVGLSRSYKPSKTVVLEHVRNYGLKRAEDDINLLRVPATSQGGERPVVVGDTDSGSFEKFSLSSSLESLMGSQFLSLVQIRIQFNVGWAGAELLHSRAMKSQQKPEVLFGLHEQAIRAADRKEARLYQTYSLPTDALPKQTTEELNLPLLAYSYLLRRFMLCSRFCLVCHTQIATANFEPLKPYVCDSKLCTYQYYALNFGPSIEYEICANTQVVDLLVSLAYISAREGQLSESLPIGIGLRVPVPKPLPVLPVFPGFVVTPPRGEHVKPDRPSSCDGLCDFDELSLPLMRAAIVEMIDLLPPITEMKAHLEHKVPGKLHPQLRTIDETIPQAAWSILRWCVASSTAHLEEITDVDELVSNIDPKWRQFRFSADAPDKEARYKASLEVVQKRSPNTQKYPALYAFHGSPLKNWHSIIRQGLLVKAAAHGRSHGNGVYLARDGSISMGYCSGGSSRWPHSGTDPSVCVALVEIVNSPGDFVCQDPFYVVAQVDWILCRYLLVQSVEAKPVGFTTTQEHMNGPTEYVALDPSQPLTLNMKPIMIPEQSHKLHKLLEARRAEAPEDDMFDEVDRGVFDGTLVSASQLSSSIQHQINNHGSEGRGQREAAADWQHNEEWCDESTYVLLPPPSDSTRGAALALHKELTAMRKEQEKAVKEHALAHLGWYMPPQLIGDNLFRWMIELHSFDPELPIAQDMISHNVPSLLFEVRFPASFPNQPPFFRIIKPRFLPFIAGGGGHVTGGGSICMDLLVSDGWLPSYNISAILLQIKLAISNLDPRPARLAKNWDTPYTVSEALEGFRRAARAHGWTVPDGLEKLVR